MAGRSAAAVSGVVAGLSLVPSPVVAREPRHELLRVFLLDVFEEGGCFSSSQGRRWLAAMNDDHVVAALDVLESVRSRHEYETTNAPNRRDRISAHAAVRSVLPPGFGDKDVVFPPQSRAYGHERAGRRVAAGQCTDAIIGRLERRNNPSWSFTEPHHRLQQGIRLDGRSPAVRRCRQLSPLETGGSSLPFMSVDASTPVHRPESGNAEKLNVLAVVAFVLAILVAGQIVGFGSVTLAIFAVGAGHVALQQIKSRGGRGRTLALFALAISYAAGIWGLVTTVYWAILLAGATINP